MRLNTRIYKYYNELHNLRRKYNSKRRGDGNPIDIEENRVGEYGIVPGKNGKERSTTSHFLVYELWHISKISEGVCINLHKF